MKFINPVNGHVERVSDAWAWVLLFGGFYFVSKKMWSDAFIWLTITVLTGGLSHFVYPLLARRLVEKHYLNSGWRKAVA